MQKGAEESSTASDIGNGRGAAGSGPERHQITGRPGRATAYPNTATSISSNAHELLDIDPLVVATRQRMFLLGMK